MGAVGFFPSDDALAEGGKPGDVAVGGVDVAAHLSYLGGLDFYLPYLLAFMHQNGGHACDDRHHSEHQCGYFQMQFLVLQCVSFLCITPLKLLESSRQAGVRGGCNQFAP